MTVVPAARTRTFPLRGNNPIRNTSASPHLIILFVALISNWISTQALGVVVNPNPTLRRSVVPVAPPFPSNCCHGSRPNQAILNGLESKHRLESFCLFAQSPMQSQPDDNNNNTDAVDNDSKESKTEKKPWKQEKSKNTSSALNDIDDIEAEAKAALEEAERALQKMNMDSDTSSSLLIDADAVATTEDGSKETLTILEQLAKGKLAAEDVTSRLLEKERSISRALEEEKERRAREERERFLANVQKEAIASGVGGAVLGLLAGGFLDLYLDSKGIMEVEPIYPPLVLGFLFMVASWGVGKEVDGEFVAGVGSVVRQVLGRSVLGVWEAATGATVRAVEGAKEEVMAVPGKVLGAVDRKVQETKEEIERIPSRVKDSAVERVEQVKKQVESIPDRVKDTVVKTAEDAKKGIETASLKAVEEVKATPGRVVSETKRVVVQTVEDVEERIDRTIKDTEKKIVDTVEKVVAIPTKTIEEISEQVSKILPTENIKTEEKELKMIPKPPEMPPPPSLLKDVDSEVTIDETRKISTPGLPLIPPLPLPKLSIPGVEMSDEPSIPLTKSVPAAKEEQQSEKKEDDFVLNEVSLKKIVGQIVDDDKSQEAASSVIQNNKDGELAAAIKKKKAAEARKAAKEEAQQRKQAMLEAAAEKKRQAEERREEAKRIAEEKKAEAERKRLVSVEKKAAEVRLQKAKPGATISLGFFSLGQQKGDGEVDKTAGSSIAPKGIATISKWTQNRDGSISGRISGSSAFTDGEAITTSPITTKDPSQQSVVTTVSGSRYFLGDKAGTVGAFGFLGLGTKDAPPTKTDNVGSVSKGDLSKADALAKARQNAEEKKIAALEAAEARRRQAEERKAAADAKRREAQEKLQASIAARKDAEAKRQAQQLLSSSTGGTISLGAMTNKKKDVKNAEKLISTARPGATISLGFMGFGQKDEPSTPSSSPSITAPSGVATIRKWRQNRDGSVSGLIYGSPAFKDGESITTSPIKIKNPTEKSVVTTISGSKYFLDDAGMQSLLGGFFGSSSPGASSEVESKTLAESRKQEELEKRKAAIEAAEARKKEAEEKRKALLEAAEAKRREAEAKRIALREAARKREEEIEAQKQAQAKKAMSAVTNAKPRATISLGFLNFGQSSVDDNPATPSNAPRGVPSLSRWKQNSDGSITGLIYGSSAFKDGESITTSMIKGEVSENSVIQTVSGSKYYLMAKESPAFLLSKLSKTSSPAIEKSQSVLKEAKRGATISLGFLNFGNDDKQQDSGVSTTSSGSKPAPRILQKAPLGVPTISNWRKNRDGSVSGIIYGSKAFGDGDSITTSPITSDAVDGALVQTTSGSKYFLEPKKTYIDKQKAAEAAKDAENKKKQREAKKAEDTISETKSRATISLGFLNLGQTDGESSLSTTPSKGKAQPRKMPSAPRGVPTLFNWRMNRDGSITGYISGSKLYSNGESVTTSPITTDAAYGALVETASGSKYYLAQRGAKLPQERASPQPPSTSSLAASRTFSLGKLPSPRNKSPSSTPPSNKSSARTFSLGKPMLQSPKSSPVAPNSAKVNTMKAPPGIPKLVKWRKNRDSTITGFITGSSNFDEGDRITTSVIVSGSIESGQVVKTSSGSGYYLV